jgi:hypothetical protein
VNDDRYSSDVLAGFTKRQPSTPPTIVEAERDLVVEEVATGFVGAVLGLEHRFVRLEDRHGRVRLFPLGAGFLIDGKPVALRAPKAKTAPTARTASGSFAVADARARVALPSRIFVEGRHDAELVERVWGDDLRVEGVVVEYLEGVDDLDQIVKDFAPGPGRRVGVFGAHVLVVGHPFVDIWQAVKPARLGIAAWPTVPRTMEWKHGICEALGWPHEDQADIARAWKRILGRVSSYTDLEPVLLGRVEQLIDFVTATD